MADTTRSASNSSAPYLHAVKFYEDEASLGRTVAEFLAPGLLERQPAIVIATPSHGRMIINELTHQGVPVRQLESDG